MSVYIKQKCKNCDRQCVPNCCPGYIVNATGTTTQSFVVNCVGGWPDGGTVTIGFDAVNVKDQLVVSDDFNLLIDTGCVAGVVNQTANITPNTNALNFTVVADCDGTGQATVWYLLAVCTQN